MPYTRLLKLFALLALAICLLIPSAARAQSLTTGGISGVLTDPSGAVVPNAPIVATNLDTGAVFDARTTDVGVYRFSLLKPGRYELSASVSGFAKLTQGVVVDVGQETTANLRIEVTKSVATVEVTATESLVSTSSSINTTFSEAEVQQLPNPGNDITTIALTAPGTVSNNTGGYGNFTTYGLPATSNLFTVNGENDMDPYFNINNSGASNLNLGSNEIQEVTVTSNAYAGEYGQLAGAQVTEITKSGTNRYHGNALYWWNGRTMNSNDWMLNNSGTPRPFSNANQWASSLGGPIRKDSTFFFVDTEGLRFILPNSFDNTIPTPAFATAVVNNITANQPNEAPTYQKLFSLYAASPGAGSATPITPLATSACAALSLPGFASGTPCFAKASGSGGLLGWEWILATRVDQKMGKNDNLYGRYRGDHGLQPTYIDPINTNFNALSSQPSWDWQANEVHVFGPRATNSFMATLSHYVAQFQQNESKALSTFPYDSSFGGSAPFTSFGLLRDFPQGRNITQYQFIDDFTLTYGKHSLKFGENFRRYDVSDHNFFYNNPLARETSLSEFANGLFTYYRKALNFSSDVPIALWGAGFYAQDEWNVKSNLKLTFGLRLEHNSNPVCQKNCFSNFVSTFSNLPSFKAGAGAGNVPYTQDIKFNQHQAYQGVDAINPAPRFGFSWSPLNNSSLVISGGYGFFYDNAPAGLVDDLLANPPVAVRLTVQPAAGTLAYDTTSNGSAATWAASANAFNTGFAGGQTYTQIKASLAALGVPFAPPSFTSIIGTVHSPLWQEWNLQVQKGFGKSTALTVNYVGNHGQRIAYTNGWQNAFDTSGLFPTLLPSSAPVPNYGSVNQLQSGAISNYHGMSVALSERYGSWLTAKLNYTWSHNLDESSNGGIFTYGDSIQGQLNPNSLRAGNYGNSDYDIRHLLNGTFILTPKFPFGNVFAKQALNGWQLASKIFVRTGLPMSVADGNTSGVVKNYTQATILAQPIAGVAGQTSCGRGNATATGAANIPGCLNAAAFVDTSAATFVYTSFPTQARNQYRGPGFTDVDMSLFKTFSIRERMKFGIGATAFNVFNHPNFFLPNNTFLTGDATFGQISSMTNSPTSPYGAFFGFDSSVRVVQLSAKIEF
jgi:Carboxypeptidase regulatory-like domain